MKDMVESVILSLKDKVDYLEIRVEDFLLTEITIKGKSIEVLKEAIEKGGCVRAIHRGGTGFASFNHLEDMEKYALLAIEQARLTGRDKTILAPVPVVRVEVEAPIKKNPAHVPVAKKLEILKGYSDLIMSAGGRIKTSSIRYRDFYKTTVFGNSEGSLITHTHADMGVGMSAIAVGDGQMQMGYVGAGSSDDFDVILGLEGKLREACRTAEALIDAPTIKSGKYTLIADPHLAGTFVHEAFGHISEAEKVYENKRLLELMKIGTVFGRPILNIYDTGLTSGSRGMILYDEEGVEAKKTDLIREGRLVGRLHTRETAGRLGEEATGSARAINYHFPPIPRMRNTCIGQGESTFEEMISDIDEGVYALNAMGGQAEEMFTFTAGKAYMIRKGKIEEMVKNVTISGSLFETLKNIDMIGNDFTQVEGGGGCGKGDGWKFQFPLPVANGSPHIRIRDVVIGGE
jgi:TldD protein